MTSIVEQRVLSVFDLVEEPRDELYRRLIMWCGEHCATALLVIRDVDDLSEESANILKRLEDSLTTVERSSQWPGTVLLSSNDTALVYRYRLTPQTVELFCTLVDGLYEWVEPKRPDDLCFTRADAGDNWSRARRILTAAARRSAIRSGSIADPGNCATVAERSRAYQLESFCSRSYGHN